ncbi:1671_t:CDS:1 [Funneliformis geosporum]|uniref:18832_t:CDS:1 n=1 Tax=Funneliformis geosporum TaxID=1117311 RepID=A0A9W4WNH8_9GLOM|nr:18832_t:CDS:1 [Funneliformis geosporum]CAI2181627.1 1671_t:CDS:1 [Funneliformis geosporum]
MAEKGPKSHTNNKMMNQSQFQGTYQIHTFDFYDWKLFMWFASLKQIQHVVHLFIIIWDATPIENDMDLAIEFNDETSKMVEIIEELNSLGAVDDLKFSKVIDNYRDYRYNNPALKNKLINSAWKSLEASGLHDFSHAVSEQLDVCSNPQKLSLRQMIFSRMKSFNILATQMSKVKETSGTNSLLKENEKLKNQILALKKENSQQQAALGNITNVSWNYDDPNNAAKLISDIEELQDLLSDFTMVQGGDYKINDMTSENLLKDYKCQVEYPSMKGRVVLGAVLQRYVITTILKEAELYLKSTPSSEDHAIDISLECDIVNATENLIRYTELFKDNRKGEDEFTKITPDRIRQQSYSALGCRGFSNDEHPLIKGTVDKLLNELDKFRQVVDKETNDELHDQAIKITRSVINIFCFRLKTQSLKLKHQFFEAGHDVDARLMQGSFGRDDSKRVEVEVCAFPCIGVFNGDDRSNQSVFTKAQVITRPKRSNSGNIDK